MRLGYLFPGQGAQYIGMGKELIETYKEAKQLFAQADDALGFSLSRIILEGPEEQLRLTYHTQPALLTVSVAAYRVFSSECGDVVPVVCAGHSLGEYSALVAAGAIDFTDAVRLVHHRGKWMDEAVPAGQGAMTAVMGMERDKLEEVCRQAAEEAGVVELANINSPGQIVISGTAEGVERAAALAKEQGARRTIPLVVSGPFHCSLMKPAASKLKEMLLETDLKDTSVPVVANVDAQPKTHAQDIRTALERQLYSPVLWEEDVRAMMQLGAEGFIEFGPGTVLSGLVKKVERRIPTFHVENEESLQQTMAAIKG
ncbi:ACP S-malonyltransferase [Alicyclobacillus sp. SO9]|uniref:ACP S-malonyltransferase n=1 Tax=Alicyclobacillus sp. SO9 TaxID=2665646 RepID=UPI0018E7456B|nr:ACP S-malonyltransferase [Alicyclobacillus sp. SO9]QQE80761.1 ACP S-malonyltransferase [Alicyclobacillus sp. SO9]